MAFNKCKDCGISISRVSKRCRTCNNKRKRGITYKQKYSAEQAEELTKKLSESHKFINNFKRLVKNN